MNRMILLLSALWEKRGKRGQSRHVVLCKGYWRLDSTYFSGNRVNQDLARFLIPRYIWCTTEHIEHHLLKSFQRLNF